MIPMNTKWKANGLGEWFKVRVTQELILYTGLCRQQQAEHLRSLQNTWHLIETRRCADRSGTEVRFNKLTMDRLAAHCIVRLKGYEGGISNAPSTPQAIYIWLRPDLDGYDWCFSEDKLESLREGLEENERPNISVMRQIMLDG
jgi:hypothetical protein